MPTFKLIADPFSSRANIRLWERYYYEDPSATPFQGPEFHAAYHQFGDSVSALLVGGDCILPLCKRSIGFGLTVGALSPIGQYGGPLGGNLRRQQRILDYALDSTLCAEAHLPVGSRLRLGTNANVQLTETSALYRAGGGWPAFVPSNRQARFKRSGIRMHCLPPGGLPAALYNIYSKQHDRWGRSPMPKLLFEQLARISEARIYSLRKPNGEFVAFYLNYNHGSCSYYHRGANTQEGRRLDVHRILHQMVLDNLPSACLVYDLGSSPGLPNLKEFKLSLGASDVPTVTLRKVTMAARIRKIISTLNLGIRFGQRLGGLHAL